MCSLCLCLAIFSVFIKCLNAKGQKSTLETVGWCIMMTYYVHCSFIIIAIGEYRAPRAPLSTQTLSFPRILDPCHVILPCTTVPPEATALTHSRVRWLHKNCLILALQSTHEWTYKARGTEWANRAEKATRKQTKSVAKPTHLQAGYAYNGRVTRSSRRRLKSAQFVFRGVCNLLFKPMFAIVSCTPG